jgi:excisionase family DNA binding protein
MLPTANESPTVTIAAAAKALSVCKATAYSLARSGELPTIKVGGSLRVPTRELREMLRLDAPEARTP